jgi:hypothetical protein
MVLNKTRKRKISNELFGYSRERVKLDYEQLRQVTCKNIKQFSPLAILGTKFIDHYTGMERLNTAGNKGINFYDFWDKRNKYKKEKYVQNMLEYYKNYPTFPLIKQWKYIFNLYFSAITLFRPITAMEVYCKYRPHTVLDFTMGWGGRLLGAAALDIPRYIGIDLNPNLEAPYKKMVRDLEGLTKTKFELYFQDALTMDYSKLEYDMVFTSPPYYNIEIYTGSVIKDKEEWNDSFYTPLFSVTWKHLQRGGYYCLNVPVEVYKAVCLPLFGGAKTRIPLKKTKRTEGEKYKEYIYVWKKGN